MRGGLFNPAEGETAAPRWRGVAVSAVAHGVMLAVGLGLLHSRLRVERVQVPGTAHGMERLTYFSAGSVASASAAAPKKHAAEDGRTVMHPALAAPKPVDAAGGETGTAHAVLDGAGEGRISMALEKVFPYPRPDLSMLPHGTRGDVIVDAVVGADGKIATLTLVQGLGPAIDDVVLATVKGWSYVPAMKDGVPVASKQELHFHYERA